MHTFKSPDFNATESDRGYGSRTPESYDPENNPDRLSFSNQIPKLNDDGLAGDDGDVYMTDDDLWMSETTFSDSGSSLDIDEHTACRSTESCIPAVLSQRRRRKSTNPTKSPEPEDPKFKGVTVQFRTRILHNQVQVVLTAYFNCRKLARRRWRQGVVMSSLSPNSNTSACTRGGTRQAHNWPTTGKQCASCCTRKTPLWRDAEDGTPLCNACGIRYKKYRVRCGHCWFVPKKESKTNPVCTSCGEILRFSVFRFKPTLI